MSRLEAICAERGITMTEQRRIIVKVLSESEDHPDVETICRRCNAVDPRISVATVYRTLKLLEELSVLDRHDFGDGRGRYEAAPEVHHDHLVDLNSGEVLEFKSEEIERLQVEIARSLGYDLSGHRMELFGVKLGAPQDAERD